MTDAELLAALGDVLARVDPVPAGVRRLADIELRARLAGAFELFGDGGADAALAIVRLGLVVGDE